MNKQIKAVGLSILMLFSATVFAVSEADIQAAQAQVAQAQARVMEVQEAGRKAVLEAGDAAYAAAINQGEDAALRALRAAQGQALANMQDVIRASLAEQVQAEAELAALQAEQACAEQEHVEAEQQRRAAQQAEADAPRVAREVADFELAQRLQAEEQVAHVEEQRQAQAAQERARAAAAEQAQAQACAEQEHVEAEQQRRVEAEQRDAKKRQYNKDELSKEFDRELHDKSIKRTAKVTARIFPVVGAAGVLRNPYTRHALANAGAALAGVCRYGIPAQAAAIPAALRGLLYQMPTVGMSSAQVGVGTVVGVLALNTLASHKLFADKKLDAIKQLNIILANVQLANDLKAVELRVKSACKYLNVLNDKQLSEAFISLFAYYQRHFGKQTFDMNKVNELVDTIATRLLELCK